MNELNYIRKVCFSESSLYPFEVVVNFGLYTSFNTSNVVSHGVEACLSGVHFDQFFELVLASLEPCFPIMAERLAELHHNWFRIDASV